MLIEDYGLIGEHETADGAVRVVDFMPPRMHGPPRVMRIVEGLRELSGLVS